MSDRGRMSYCPLAINTQRLHARIAAAVASCIDTAISYRMTAGEGVIHYDVSLLIEMDDEVVVVVATVTASIETPTAIV